MTRLAVLAPFALLALVAACGEAAGDGGTSDGDAAKGKTVYEANCAACHGADGQGGGGFPAIAGEVESDFASTVKNGKGGMPAFSNLTDAEIADLEAYVASL